MAGLEVGLEAGRTVSNLKMVIDRQEALFSLEAQAECPARRLESRSEADPEKLIAEEVRAARREQNSVVRCERLRWSTTLAGFSGGRARRHI